ncbi:M12 family metallo-peptidase [Flavobacterium rhizosphaerae]|uniref:M12 family metallo-peptidase n=1 Tax=Flavobacterium rhizosphaerae TaxID=3163298 RepID=A0ABW8YYB6_9FLAO
MKKFYYILALLFALPVFAQHKVGQQVERLMGQQANFRPVMPLSVNSWADKAHTEKAVKNATYARINPQELHTVVSHAYNTIALTLPYNGTDITLLLYKVDITAEGFHVDTDKQKNIPVKNGVYYRGIISGDYTSVAAFTFFNDEFSGIASSAQLGNIVAGRRQKAGNTTDYIVYSDANLTVLNNFTCSTDGGITGVPAQQFGQKSPQNTLSEHCVTVYFELDYSLYVQNNFSTNQTVAWITAAFNNVQTLFANDGITTAIKSVFVWTEPDPYSGVGSGDYLFQFYQMRPVFDGDVGQLLGMDNGGFGGVAIDVAGLCSDYNISYGDIYFEFEEVPLFSWTVEVITHELGHLYGSPHTHGCYWNGNNTAIDGCGTEAGFVEGNCDEGPIPDPAVKGTIMSYCHLVPGVGINFANGFGPQPANRILNHITSSSCLSTDCINTCINTVSAFSVMDNSMQSATIMWTDDNGGPWEVGYNTINSAITNWQTVTENTFTVNNLNPETYYTFGVRPICVEGMEPETHSVIFTGGANWCSGATFTDTGGAFGNYGNKQHLIRTIRPESPSESFTVTFTQFSLEENYDYMYVYDGADTTAPLLGAYTGNEIPGPFVSSATDGALTFEFISDEFSTQAGWNATVSCVLGIDEAAFTQFQYYPNPTNGNLHISAGQTINHIMAYNISGQLLFDKAVNGTVIDTDISAFASGVYIFKVTGDNREAYFRIIKQ